MPRTGIRKKTFTRKKSNYAKRYRKKRLTEGRVKAIARAVTYKAAETKYLCTTKSATSINTTTALIDFAWQQVPQGDGNGTRDGNMVRGMYLMFRGLVMNGDAENIVRLMVVTSQNDDVTGGELVAAAPDSVYACTTPEFRAKYHMIWDHVINMRRITSSDGTTVLVQKKFNLKGLRLDYGGSATQIPTKHGLYLLAVSDSSIAPDPSIQYDCQFCYKDI